MTKGTYKIAMLLDNPFEHDNRVYMEAHTLAAKYDITIFAVKASHLPEIETIDGIKVNRIFPLDIYKYSNRKTFKAYAEELLKEGFNIIHCHDHLMLEIGVLVKKMNKNVKLIYDSHELFHSWPLNTTGYSRVNLIKAYIVRRLRVREEKQNGRQIDRLVTVNDSLAKILKKYFRLNSEPLVLWNTPYFAPLESGTNILRKKYNIPDDIKILVFIGMKIFPHSLNLERVIDETGNVKGICLIFISSADSNQKYFEQYVATKGFRNIFFHPLLQRKEMVPYLSGCDVGLVPTWNKDDLSYWYALDNKLFIYIASGIPILATAQPEYRSIVEKFNVGVCVNPDLSQSAYLDGLKNIISNYTTYKENSMKAREALNWENESKKLLDLYIDLTA